MDIATMMTRLSTAGFSDLDATTRQDLVERAIRDVGSSERWRYRAHRQSGTIGAASITGIIVERAWVDSSEIRRLDSEEDAHGIYASGIPVGTPTYFWRTDTNGVIGLGVAPTGTLSRIYGVHTKHFADAGRTLLATTPGSTAYIPALADDFHDAILLRARQFAHEDVGDPEHTAMAAQLERRCDERLQQAIDELGVIERQDHVRCVSGEEWA